MESVDKEANAQHPILKLHIPGVQKVKIYDAVWYMVNCCCSLCQEIVRHRSQIRPQLSAASPTNKPQPKVIKTKLPSLNGFNLVLNGWQLAKMKKRIPDMSLP